MASYFMIIPFPYIKDWLHCCYAGYVGTQDFVR